MNPSMMMHPSFCSMELQAERDCGVFVPDCPHNGLLAVRDNGGVLEVHQGKAAKGARVDELARIRVEAAG